MLGVCITGEVESDVGGALDRRGSVCCPGDEEVGRLLAAMSSWVATAGDARKVICVCLGSVQSAGMSVTEGGGTLARQYCLKRGRRCWCADVSGCAGVRYRAIKEGTQ